MNLDAPSLRQRARELGAGAGAQRIAAAEAHLRLAVIGAEPREAAAAKALALDPYRADAHLVLAVERLRAGALAEALALLDDAARLAPRSSRVRLHRAYALLALARANDDGAGHAAAARLEFEGLVDTFRVPAVLGALEAAILDDERELEPLFARIPRDASVVPAVARLLVLGVLGSNVEGARRCGVIASAWREVFPDDVGLRGAIGAARAREESPETLCARVATYADEIADAAMMNLIVRDRISEVADPKRRLALFEEATQKLPASDASSRYRLALLDEVARGARAGGRPEAAREAWGRCLAVDPDDLCAIEGLLTLAEEGSDETRAAELRARLVELWILHAEHGPRPEGVFASAAIRAASLVERDIARLELDPPSLAAVESLARRTALALALGRLGADAELRRETPVEACRALLAGDAAAFDRAIAVVESATSAVPASGELVMRVVRAGVALGPGDVAGRIRLAGILWRFRGALAIDRGEFTRACAEVAYGGVLEAARAEYKGARPENAVDLLARYVEPGASLPELQYTYLVAILEDPRLELAAAVELAKSRATGVLDRLRPEDPPFIAARLRRIAEAPFEEVARDAAIERASNLLNARSDSKGALAALFAAYPGTRPTVPPLRFASEVWGEMPPAGRGVYALIVAQAIRSNVIRWYNAAQAHAEANNQPGENGPNRATASHMFTLCEHWAGYAKGALPSDPVDDEARLRHGKAIDELLAILRADRFAVLR